MKVPISTATENIAMMMPKMNFTIPNMTSPTMQRAIYPNQATKVMRVLVVSWTYYLNIVLAYGFVHHTDFLVRQSACIAIDDVAE